MIELRPKQVADSLDARVGRVDMKLCYCSVYDECWWADYGNPGEPEPVEACRIDHYGDGMVAFRQ